MSEMLPQPPPNAPAPPPSEFAINSKRKLGWLLAIGILCMLSCGLLLFVMHSGRRGPDFRKDPFSNARQLGLALFEFEIIYGSFPDSSTIALLKRDFPSSTIPLGTRTSNDFFRQLMVSEIVQSERIFFSNYPDPTDPKPDDVFHGSRALEKGECGFAYIAGLSSLDGPNTPLVITPLIPGTLRFDYKFCYKHFGGNAIILKIDNSITSLPVTKSGQVIINGKDLFDPSQPFWNGKTPDVKWPE